MIIRSLDNKEIKRYDKLKHKKYREEESLFMVEGFHLVEEAYKKNVLEKVIVVEGKSFSFPIDTIYVTKEVMKKLSSLDTPSDIIGICKISNQKEILGNKVLLLDHIQDPGNLGTIIRSSKAFGVDTIVLSNDTVDLYNPKVIRATQGILFHINVIRSDLKEVIDELKKQNYTIYSTNVVDGEDIKKIKKSEKYALIMGNEGNGVSSDIANLADQNLYIKMNKDVESLNVGVATSIILYELER